MMSPLSMPLMKSTRIKTSSIAIRAASITQLTTSSLRFNPGRHLQLMLQRVRLISAHG